MGLRPRLARHCHEAPREAFRLIETIERRQELKIACPEEIAYRMGYISEAALLALAERPGKSKYGAYLRVLLAERVFWWLQCCPPLQVINYHCFFIVGRVSCSPHEH